MYIKKGYLVFFSLLCLTLLISVSVLFMKSSPLSTTFAYSGTVTEIDDHYIKIEDKANSRNIEALYVFGGDKLIVAGMTHQVSIGESVTITTNNVVDIGSEESLTYVVPTTQLRVNKK